MELLKCPCGTTKHDLKTAISGEWIRKVIEGPDFRLCSATC